MKEKLEKEGITDINEYKEDVATFHVEDEETIDLQKL